MVVDRHQLQDTYRAYTDQQLLRLAVDIGSLTDEARDVLSQELQRRKLGERDLAPYREEQAEMIRQWNQNQPSFADRLLGHFFFPYTLYLLYKSLRDVPAGKQGLDDQDSEKPHR